MKKPKGFEIKGKKDHVVCRLERSLYELKQYPRYGVKGLIPSWYHMVLHRLHIIVVSI